MKTLFSALAFLLLFASCDAPGPDDRAQQAAGVTTVDDTTAQLNEQDLRYQAGTMACNSFAVTYLVKKEDRMPVVLIIPEWWGLNDYPKERARQLASAGYLAIAVDLYGDRAVATTPDEAKALAGPFYADTALVRARLQAALDAARALPNADPGRVAIIGYCFGGSMALKGAMLGLPVKGAVCFHGSLAGTSNRNVPILVCHGGADKNVPPAEVAAWRKSMDSLKADYKFVSYPGATHAFTNPKATEIGKQFKMPIEYNEAADKASWAEMMAFLKRVL